MMFDVCFPLTIILQPAGNPMYNDLQVIFISLKKIAMTLNALIMASFVVEKNQNKKNKPSYVCSLYE